MKKVREGYKITEFGEIPSEWEVKKLKDLGNSVIGLTYSPDDLVDGCNGTLVLRSSNIRNNRIVFDDNKYVNKDIQEKLIVKENDILICSRNGSKELIGKCALIDKKAEGSSFGAFMTVYRSKYNKYLFNVFTSYMFKRQIYNNLGATINQITTDNLNNFKIIVPTIKEQEKIASILSTVDEQIDNVDALIEKNKELKKGLMQTLLTKGIGHTKFKKTEIGEIPDEWELESMNKIVTSTQLGTNTLGKENEKIPMLKMGNLTIGGFDFNKLEYISEEELEMNKEYILSNGDFLFNTRNTLELVGKSAVWNSQIDKAIFNSNIMRIKYCSKINDFYMGYYFSSDIGWKQLKSISTGTTSVAAIYTKDLMKIIVIIPSIGEQEKIVSILLEVDKKIEEYENKKQKLEELKKGLMQQLLTGKIRVI